MRTPALAGLLAAVVILTGCNRAEPTTNEGASPSPSASSLARQYTLTPQVCAQIKLDDLKLAIPLSVVFEKAVNWDMPANFLYTGGIKCQREYGADTRTLAYVHVGLATYDSPKGARLAYDTRLFKETVEGSLPGVELMSQAHTANDHQLYIHDGNLFVEVLVGVIGDDRTFDQVGIGGNVGSTVESFAGRLVERLRSGQVGG